MSWQQSSPFKTIFLATLIYGNFTISDSSALSASSKKLFEPSLQTQKQKNNFKKNNLLIMRSPLYRAIFFAEYPNRPQPTHFKAHKGKNSWTRALLSARNKQAAEAYCT
jgi:hypothetical protein